MKTCSSFFPTRTHLKSREMHRQRTLQLIKLQQTQHSNSKLHTEPYNIFQDNGNIPQKQDTNNSHFRPVGGLQLFKKTEQNNKERRQYRKGSKKSNKEGTLRNIVSSNGSKFRRDRVEPEEFREAAPLKQINEKEDETHNQAGTMEEFLASHASYQPVACNTKARISTVASKNSTRQQNLKRPMTSKKWRQEEWAASQRKEYHDKSALLNEINYNKPLVEIYGDRYFEYILRNRFQEDFKPHPYVYLLSGKKFTDNKAIATLKHYRPDLKEPQTLALRGKKVCVIEED